jgi:membrane-bound lytic murein transglycosylase F
MARAIVIVLLSLSLLAVPKVEGMDGMHRYDELFTKYTERLFGAGFDWRYFKAQALAESTMRPDARSPKGALGIMQLMPGTFEEVVREHPWIERDIHDPEWNIAAGICYNRSLWDLWDGGRPFKERLNFMLGAYNAGKGNILKAQKIALDEGLDARCWEAVEKTLHRVIKSGSRGIITYVNRVHAIRARLGQNLAQETHGGRLPGT